MGLSETFDHMRDQLLVMDPVPSVNRAYSMILRVEKQREANMEGNETADNAAMQIRTGGKKDFITKGGQQRRTYVDKKGQRCKIKWDIQGKLASSYMAPRIGIKN
ncbi:UNVERIFIED_CONTAM: hypothetical protein Sindi_0541100 [Sesamum indicum]